MKSLGGIFERKQCLHIARRSRRKFQLQFEPPCWKHHMQCIKGSQWLMGFANCEQRRKNRKKKNKKLQSDVTRLMSVMCHRVNVCQLHPDLFPLPRNCEKWRSQLSHTITSRMTNPSPPPLSPNRHRDISIVFYKDWSTIVTCPWVAMLI